ncbi:hypothetical protein BAUCODRAFT_467752 [Baudoinia panamericana UAMH 10762]|uniref:Uncharacterized protein n=1 Tax=Baudoinia panamericana (strain UAMH 10762) TaxID=717646 RepID=M2NBG7_BAUPA|nr:uncharacterized protein BAUCODRAFT_467752 [Baudoinia panamericana UAMH 10762]EMC96245.1 hypothetical protein BAUCODRAFT_467752 [Baudoinia panamericana UAMH 10762]
MLFTRLRMAKLSGLSRLTRKALNQAYLLLSPTLCSALSTMRPRLMLEPCSRRLHSGSPSPSQSASAATSNHPGSSRSSVP